tara:strand:- start:225 stop:551 length:327 start_codon:yes stop_codon:yes gene_type:complete
MFEILFGNSSVNKSLLYLARFEEGYPTQIAKNFDLPLNMIQLQLEKLERAGVLVSLKKGRTRVYTWNPRYLLKPELLALLKRAFDFMPESIIQKYYTKRTRPRRKGKP